MARLRSQVRKCSFQDKDIHVRNRLVAGCGYPRLQERLLSIPDLTVDKAVTIARLHEKAHDEAERLSQAKTEDKPGPEMLYVKSKSKAKESSVKAGKCYRCGLTNHLSDQCFYKFKDCYKCGKKGHARAVCRDTGKNLKKEERKVHTVDEAEEVYDMYHMEGKGHKSYQICVTLEDEQVAMEVDTGAARSIMSYDSFCKLKKDQQENGASQGDPEIVRRSAVEGEGQGQDHSGVPGTDEGTGTTASGRPWSRTAGKRLDLCASAELVGVGIATCASFATCCRADAFSRQQLQQQAAEV